MHLRTETREGKKTNVYKTMTFFFVTKQ